MGDNKILLAWGGGGVLEARLDFEDYLESKS